MIQSYEERLASFEEQSPQMLINRFLDSIHSYFVLRELNRASECGVWYLLLMGIHACILTINEKVFGFEKKEGKNGFKVYLEKFVDGEQGSLCFSRYSDDIYERRNVLAHQWFGEIGHRFAFDGTIEDGIRKENDAIILNPAKYYSHFESSFRLSGYLGKQSIRNYTDNLPEEKMRQAKDRMIRSFRKA